VLFTLENTSSLVAIYTKRGMVGVTPLRPSPKIHPFMGFGEAQFVHKRNRLADSSRPLTQSRSFHRTVNHII
jgi:hypothetical protein